MRSRCLALALIVQLGVVCAPAGVALAETIADAMASAYRKDPRLATERANVRAADERLARAQSGYRPRLTGRAALSSQRLETKPGSITDGTTHPRQYSLELSQPIYDGFRTTNAEREADANIEAARYVLIDQEREVLLEAASAYLGVVRDREILQLRKENLGNLGEELVSTRSRLAAGELTRTDLAQTESRLARARSELANGQASLTRSIAEFARVIGHEPGSLELPPAIEASLPRSLATAVRQALEQHPAILASKAAEEAAQFTVKRVEAGLMPRVDLEASYSGVLDPNDVVERNETAIVTGRVTVPLYEAGEISAQVREAKELRVSRAARIQTEQKRVVAEVHSAWAGLEAAREQVSFAAAQIKAAALALEGVRREAEFGTRSLIEVLNAEQELLEAKIAAARSDFEVLSASYQVVAAAGALTIEQQGIETALYDPEDHYQATDWRVMGTDTPDERYQPESAGDIVEVENQWSTTVEEEPGVTVDIEEAQPGVPEIVRPAKVANGRQVDRR